MGQVPVHPAATPLGLVGDGRVARHLQHYLTGLGLPIRTWARRTSDLPPPEALGACGTILILIHDAEIVPFVSTWPALREKRLAHCSGSLVTPVVEGAHPLMTFGPTLYAPDVYRSIPFVLEAGRTPFRELLPGLPNPSFAIPAAERSYYHALCVMAGNFSTLLWAKLFDELEQRYGIPRAVAYPYLARVAANVQADGARALTGPLARGDHATVAANLESLEGDPFHAVYTAFARIYDQRA